MPIKADYHLHSEFSGDCTAKMETMILSGIKHGLTHICFTEHHDIDYPYQVNPTEIFELDAEAYRHALLTYQDKYKSKIRILFGVELGTQAHILPQLKAYTETQAFDYILASSHICHKKDPYYPDFYKDRSEQEAYGEYFSSILENVTCFSDYDVYAHLDYVVRYGPTKNRHYSYSMFSDLLDEILKTLIAKGKGIELNTGGFRAGLGDTNPCADIVKRYKELGGEIITVGSDAHEPHFVSEYFDRAAALLESIGFKYYCTFEKRLPTYHAL